MTACYNCGEKPWTVYAAPPGRRAHWIAAIEDHPANVWVAGDGPVALNPPIRATLVVLQEWCQVAPWNTGALSPEVITEMLLAGHLEQLHELLVSIGGALFLSPLPGLMGLNVAQRVICATSDFPAWAVEVAKNGGQFPLVQLHTGRDPIILGVRR